MKGHGNLRRRVAAFLQPVGKKVFLDVAVAVAVAVGPVVQVAITAIRPGTRRRAVLRGALGLADSADSS
jgi:hypothetical protein